MVSKTSVGPCQSVPVTGVSDDRLGYEQADTEADQSTDHTTDDRHRQGAYDEVAATATRCAPFAGRATMNTLRSWKPGAVVGIAED
jgi:hypothetical protein